MWTCPKATDVPCCGKNGAELKSALNVLRDAEETLVKTMRYLVKILSGALGKDDPCWEAFGLNIPVTPSTPWMSTNLNATVEGSQILAPCDRAERATRSRFRGRIVGIEAQYRLLASSLSPIAMLKGSQAGLTLEIVVQAVNGGSQSVASDPILVTMPAMTTLSATTKPGAAPVGAEEELAAFGATVPNGTSNGNGSHALSRLS